MKTHPASIVLACLFATVGCSKNESHKDHGDHGDHADHATKDGHAKGHASPLHIDLGSAKIGDYQVRVFQGSKLVAGKEAEFDVEFPGATALPGTVRAWIGQESSQGSVKTKLDKEEGTTMHGHVDVPTPLAPNAQLWIEIEAKGATTKGSFAIKP